MVFKILFYVTRQNNFFFQIVFNAEFYLQNFKVFTGLIQNLIGVINFVFFEKFLCRLSNGEEHLSFGDAGCISAVD